MYYCGLNCSMAKSIKIQAFYNRALMVELQGIVVAVRPGSSLAQLDAWKVDIADGEAL